AFVAENYLVTVILLGATSLFGSHLSSSIKRSAVGRFTCLFPDIATDRTLEWRYCSSRFYFRAGGSDIFLQIFRRQIGCCWRNDCRQRIRKFLFSHHFSLRGGSSLRLARKLFFGRASSSSLFFLGGLLGNLIKG